MPDVLGIRFKPCGKVYDFEVNGLEVREGDHVIVESDFGLSLGKVIKGRRTIEKGERELKRVVRAATEEDFRTKEENKQLEKEARGQNKEAIKALEIVKKIKGIIPVRKALPRELRKVEISHLFADGSDSIRKPRKYIARPRTNKINKTDIISLRTVHSFSLEKNLTAFIVLAAMYMHIPDKKL